MRRHIQIQLFKQIINQLYNYHSMSQSAKPAPVKQSKRLITTQTVFKTINILLICLTAFCVKGFFHFRQVSIQKGLYVFALPSAIWCLIGFLGRWIVKYSYLKFSHTIMSQALSEKQESEEDREYRLKSLKKLSFDFLFYIGITVWAYHLFRNEYWFPLMAGGKGQCGRIYSQYPNWPSHSETATNMQHYFMVQMGIHLFSLYQLIFVIGRSYRKYHEFLLHHCITITLILFSMFSNQIAAGVIIIIIHDTSDIFSSFCRGYIETKFRNKLTMVIGFLTMLFSWVYLRAIVYPFCILRQVWGHVPRPEDHWFIINFEYKALAFMASILVGMHLFWIYFILVFAFKKADVNTHEAATPGKKSK